MPALLMEDVQGRVLGRDPRGELSDGLSAADVEDDRRHAGIAGRHLVKQLPPSACYDNLVAKRLEGLRQLSTDAGRAAGNQDRVA